MITIGGYKPGIIGAVVGLSFLGNCWTLGHYLHSLVGNGYNPRTGADFRRLNDEYNCQCVCHDPNHKATMDPNKVKLLRYFYPNDEWRTKFQPKPIYCPDGHVHPGIAPEIPPLPGSNTPLPPPERRTSPEETQKDQRN